MDNTPLNFAGGNALLGGTDALQQAIARRRTGQSSPTQAVTPSAASFDPTLQSPQLPNPQASPASTVPSGGVDTSMGASLGAPTQSPETELIVKALDSRLKSLSKIQGA